MQPRNTLGKVMLLAGLTLGIALCVRITLAQRAGSGSLSSGQSRGYPYGSEGGRQSPFLKGTITGGNAQTGSISVQNQNGGTTTIQCNNSTQFTTQQTVSASSLKVGDTIQVTGLPTGINASSIIDGQMPSSMQTYSGLSRGMGKTSGTGTSAGFATASGIIVSLNPLTISLGGGVAITITGSANTSVSRLVPLTYNQLKVGDTISAAGQLNSNGVFVASGVAVNLGR